MEQIEEGTSETELSENEHISILVTDTGSHEVNKVCMSDLNECGYLTLEFFREISLACVLTMVRKFEFLDSDVVLFVGCFVDVRAGTSANLFLKLDVLYSYSEVFLAGLK